MGTLLDLAATWSLPALALAALLAGTLYLIRAAVDRSIATAFDRRAREMTLALERRSRFAETVLVERYQYVSACLIRLSEIATDINRHRAGQSVPGLIEGRELVPLTALMAEMAGRRHVLTTRFADPLDRLAQTLLAVVNAPTAQDAAEHARHFRAGLRALQDDVTATFGLDALTGPGPDRAPLASAPDGHI